MSKRVLYQFPLSHYCEKTRWQLDVKQLPYSLRNLVPGPHRLQTRWRARSNTVPMLLDRGIAVSDSTRIAYHLEKHYPLPSLLPDSATQRTRVIELEQQFDRLGAHVRRWLYGQMLDRPEVMAAFYASYSLPSPAKAILQPLTRELIRRGYGLTPKRIAYSAQKMEEGFSALEDIIANDASAFLVGDRLTLADIAGASLLAPVVAPPGSPWDFINRDDLPPALRQELARLRDRPAGQWVLYQYQHNR